MEDGATLIMVLENPGPVVLHTLALCCERSTIQAAAVSPPLKHPVARIEVSVEGFQGVDGESQLFLSLVQGAELLLRHGLWGARGRTEEALETLSIQDELVSMAEPGMVLRMEYQVGGSLAVLNWICKIYYVGSSSMEPSELVQFCKDYRARRRSRSCC